MRVRPSSRRLNSNVVHGKQGPSVLDCEGKSNAFAIQVGPDGCMITNGSGEDGSGGGGLLAEGGTVVITGEPGGEVAMTAFGPPTGACA